MIFCAGLASCANTVLQGYEGPARPDNETILVRAARNGGDRLSANIQIVSVDTPRGEKLPVSTRSVRLLPGETCIGILATSSTMDQESAELCFFGESGDEYEIRVLVAGVEQILEDTAGGRRPVLGGPFRVDRIWIVNRATSAIMAISNP
jgi:hypothetical protein